MRATFEIDDVTYTAEMEPDARLTLKPDAEPHTDPYLGKYFIKPPPTRVELTGTSRSVVRESKLPGGHTATHYSPAPFTTTNYFPQGAEAGAMATDIEIEIIECGDAEELGRVLRFLWASERRGSVERHRDRKYVVTAELGYGGAWSATPTDEVQRYIVQVPRRHFEKHSIRDMINAVKAGTLTA